MGEIDDELNGLYKNELKALSGLSRDQIERITPGNRTDLKTYLKLMAVVKEASRRNVEQAEVRKQIQELGKTAVELVKLVPSVAKKFGFL
jgi:hypothetical protein